MSKFSKKPAAPTATQTPFKLKNITLLDVREVETKNGKKKKVQFAKGITLAFNGEQIDLGEYNSAFAKDRSEIEQDLEFMVEKEYMTEEQANAEVDRIEQKGIQLVVKVKLS